MEFVHFRCIRPSDMTKHVYHAHSNQETLLTCPVKACSFKTGSKLRLTRHIKYYKHGKRKSDVSYICTRCDYKTQSWQFYQRHLGKHYKSKPGTASSEFEVNQCLYCPYVTKKFSNLQRHYDTKHKVDNRSFKCSDCELSFKRSDTLKQHKVMLHFNLLSEEEQKLANKCENCEKIFRNKTDLSSHLKKCRNPNNEIIEETFYVSPNGTLIPEEQA